MLPLLCALALAGGDDLYPPAPPIDSALVRFVGLPSVSGDVEVGGRAVGSLDPYEVGPYVVAQAGTRPLELGTLSATPTLEAGHFYTVAPLGGALVLIEDTPGRSLAKATLALYNLTDHPTLDLKTADGATAIFTGIAPGHTASREVNPLHLEVGLFDGTRALQTAPVNLAQGQHYSAFALPDGERTRLVLVHSATDTRR